MCIPNILVNIVNWFDIHQGFAMFALTLAYVLTTLLILLSQRKQFKYMTTPFIFVDIPTPYDNRLYLVIQNIGNAPAKNIKIKFKEDFKGVNGRISFKELFENRTFHLLPPNSEIKSYLDYFPHYYARKEPMLLTGHIEYENSKGDPYKEPINVNLEAYKGLIVSETKKNELNDLVKEFKNFLSKFTELCDFYKSHNLDSKSADQT